MRFIEAMGRLARGATSEEAIDNIRDEHGRGAARWLADRLGISARQARRYLAGDVRRPPAERTEAIRSGANQTRLAADRLRGARTISAPRVKVEAKSPGYPDGTRRIGTRPVSGDLRDALDRAADALDTGDGALAEELLSDGILSYGGRAGSHSDAANHLRISDFDGIDFD